MGMTNRISLTLCTLTLVLSQGLIAGDVERNQAKRIHDRLTGIAAPNATLDLMEFELVNVDSSGKTAAQIAINPAQNPAAWAFYNVTLKNFAAPWTNEEQTVFTDLNDYTATVVGTIRDGLDFRRILYDDLVYVGNAPGVGSYSMGDNNHYEALEALDPAGAGNLFNTLVKSEQSTETAGSLNPLPSDATAGIMTSRAAAMAFFSDGTNRAMFRFTLMNHLCTDLEPLKDVTRTPSRVRRDVSRSPGGDSRIFLNACVGCHAGMDGMAGAFAFYEWDYTGDKTNGSLVYTDGNVSNKHNINQDNFNPGYLTTDDSWINYWRNGPNYLLGWSDNRNATTLFKDDKDNALGNGAKSLGEELANTEAFARCQVDKVFEAVCLRGPTEFYDQDRIVRDTIVSNFKSSNYNMREVFTDVAAHCKGN